MDLQTSARRPLLKDHAGLEPYLKIAYWRAQLLMLRQLPSQRWRSLLERGNLSEAELRALMQQAHLKTVPLLPLGSCVYVHPCVRTATSSGPRET